MKEKGGEMTDDQVFHAKPKVYKSYFWEFLKISDGGFCINNCYALAKNSYEEMQSNMKTGPKIVSLSGLYFVAKFQKGGGYRYEINRCVSVVFTLVMPTLHSALGWSQKRQKIMLIPFIIPSKCHVQGGLGLSS